MAKTHFSGPLVINDQTVGTEYTILADASLNELLVTKPTASATNHLGIRNAATGNNPTLYNAGEADTGLTLAGSDGTNYEEILILDANASAANEITIDNATAGNDPSIAATGDSTNIGLQLTSKGTRLVLLGSRSIGTVASGSALINAQRGEITWGAVTTAAGTASTADLVNNKITATSHIVCTVDDSEITAGMLVANARVAASGSATIKLINVTGAGTAAGTARVNFVVL